LRFLQAAFLRQPVLGDLLLVPAQLPAQRQLLAVEPELLPELLLLGGQSSLFNREAPALQLRLLLELLRPETQFTLLNPQPTQSELALQVLLNIELALLFSLLASGECLLLAQATSQFGRLKLLLTLPSDYLAQPKGLAETTLHRRFLPSLLGLRGGEGLPTLKLALLLAELGPLQALLELRRLRHAIGLELRQVLRPGQLGEALRGLQCGQPVSGLRLGGLLEELGIQARQCPCLLASQVAHAPTADGRGGEATASQLFVQALLLGPVLGLQVSGLCATNLLEGLRIETGRLRQLLLQRPEHPRAGLLRLLGALKAGEGLALGGLRRGAGHALLLELSEGLGGLEALLLLLLRLILWGSLLSEQRADARPTTLLASAGGPEQGRIASGGHDLPSA
jgi:hypothetical protein